MLPFVIKVLYVDMEIVLLLLSFFLFLSSFSEGSDCEIHCQHEPSVRTTDCYAVVGCDFSFPNLSFSYTYHIYIVKLQFNYTGTSQNEELSRSILSYSEVFWAYKAHTVNRYIFQVEYSHGENPMYFYDFAFGILGLQPEDAGTYRVSLIDHYGLYDNVHLLHHTYRLVTIYQPSAPLLCEFQDLTSVLDDRNDYKLTCSIRNAYPVIDIKVIEPNECTFESHYSDDGIHSEVTISIIYCEGNSTVVCVAIQRQLEFMSINGYSDSCFWEMTKSNPGKLFLNLI